jgi:hypothetical protein
VVICLGAWALAPLYIWRKRAEEREDGLVMAEKEVP